MQLYNSQPLDFLELNPYVDLCQITKFIFILFIPHNLKKKIEFCEIK